MNSWRVTQGCSPSPCYPNALAWSDDDKIAVACGDVVRIFDAGSHEMRGLVTAQSLQSSARERKGAGSAASALRDRAGRKRGRGGLPENDEDDGGNGEQAAAPDFSAWPSSDPIRGLCWSPLGDVASGCLLCVSSGQVSAVLEASTSAFDVDWRVARLLQPLLRQAWRVTRLESGGGSGGGGEPLPAAASEERQLVVQSCGWSCRLTLPAAKGAAEGSVECSLLATASSGLLCVLVHAAEGADGAAATAATPTVHVAASGWGVAFSACARGAPYSCVHFGAGAAARPAEAAVPLLTGAVDGTVLLWDLLPLTSAPPRGTAAAAPGAAAAVSARPRLRGTPLRLVSRGLGPVASLSTSLVSARAHAAADTCGGGAEGELRLVVGVGQHALALRRCGSGGGPWIWRAEGEARHAQPVTSVLCTPECSAGCGLQTDGWLSAALDGQLLAGGAAEPPTAAGGEGAVGHAAAGEGQHPPQARAVPLPSVVEVVTTYNKQTADSSSVAGGAVFGMALSPCAAQLVLLQRIPTLGSVRRTADAHEPEPQLRPRRSLPDPKLEPSPESKPGLSRVPAPTPNRTEAPTQALLALARIPTPARVPASRLALKLCPPRTPPRPKPYSAPPRDQVSVRKEERFRLLTCLRAPAASLLAPAALLGAALLAPATPSTTAEAPAASEAPLASEAPELSWRRQSGASVCGLGGAAATLPAAPRLAALAALEAALAPHEVASPPPLSFLRGVQLLRALAASCRHATARGNGGGEGAPVADKRGGAEVNTEAEEVEAGGAGATEALATLAVVEAVVGAGLSEAAADEAVRLVAARAAKALLRAQALQLIATSVDGSTPRATALAAADWLLALCASTAEDEEEAAAAAAAVVANGAAGGAAGSAAGGAVGGAVRRLGQARPGDLAKVCEG